MTSSTIRDKITLWIWPSGLFPRRLVYYLRAKGITLSVLERHNIHLIPVELTSSPPALYSMQGFEARPTNSTLPIMRVEHPDGRMTWIRESLSIVDYLEELFPASAGWTDVRGDSAERRAQGRDILSLLGDAMQWSLIFLIHSDPKTTSFSGLKQEEMSASTAKHATDRLHFYLARLEQWVEADSGAMSLTLPGLILLAQVEYHEMMYGVDWLYGHQALKQWIDVMKTEAWFVSNKRLQAVERGEGWRMLLGG
ncbi:hypothetical protein SVAN01_10291 [Stagonosporopsis vannaccii]|nr:hypothetical protein SVAN01_10291 [Stagonosporopsis vannaccii]